MSTPNFLGWSNVELLEYVREQLQVLSGNIEEPRVESAQAALRALGKYSTADSLDALREAQEDLHGSLTSFLEDL